jgi:hypothetical protein
VSGGVAARITWTDGGTASIDAIEGERVELTSSRAFAPGSRPEGTIEGVIGPEREGIWMKIHGSRRNEDGSFRVTGRLLNATRELRHALKEAVGGPIGDKNPSS